VTLDNKKLNIELRKLNVNDIEQIELDWLALQSNSNCHFFLTWDWIGAWLKQLTRSFYLLSASLEGKIVALAIIVENKRKVFGCYTIKQWWLNRTGNEGIDQCWIEYNDFLLDKKYEKEIRKSLIVFLSQKKCWKEFVVGMTCSNTQQQFEQLSNYKRDLIEDYGYQVKLTEIENSYLSDVLSRNTRQKINQTERLLKIKGNIDFKVLISIDEKMDILQDIEDIHIKKWQNTSTPSGFLNSIFSSVIKKQLIAECCEVAMLSIDAQPSGYLINYLYKGRVYFYLSAFTEKFSGKIKLGMYLHSLVIEYYRLKGMTHYDFLVGDAQYKKSLSNEYYKQSMTVFFKRNILLGFEDKLKRIKNEIKEYYILNILKRNK